MMSRCKALGMAGGEAPRMFFIGGRLEGRRGGIPEVCKSFRAEFRLQGDSTMLSLCGMGASILPTSPLCHRVCARWRASIAAWTARVITGVERFGTSMLLAREPEASSRSAVITNTRLQVRQGYAGPDSEPPDKCKGTFAPSFPWVAQHRVCVAPTLAQS